MSLEIFGNFQQSMALSKSSIINSSEFTIFFEIPVLSVEELDKEEVLQSRDSMGNCS